jgi:hypothetical protein
MFILRRYSNICKTKKYNSNENHLYLASLACTLSGITLFSLYDDKKEKYTENELIYRNLKINLGGITFLGFGYHMLKLLKKI